MSDADRESPRDLAAAYALGALSPEEARAFEAAMARSPELQREVAEYRELGALLPLGRGGPGPSPALRERVLAAAPRLGGTTPSPRARGARADRRSWLLAGALVASLVLSTVLALRQSRLLGEVARRDSTLAATQRQLAAERATLDSLLTPGVQLFQLTQSGRPDAGIQLFWDRARHRALLHGYHLPALPAGRAYQLWFIRNGRPVPSVTFNTGPDGRALVPHIDVPSTGDISAAAITEEPAGGSAQPTSPILLAGPLKSKS